MRSEFLFTINTRKINLKSINDKIVIYFFGDVHRDTASCDVERWHWFLKKAKRSLEENPHTYFIGLGDYFDFASTKERKSIAKAELHETTMERFEESVINDIKLFVKETYFMKDNLLGLVGGNHEWLFSNGKFATEELCERLGTNYLGWLGLLNLQVLITGSKQVPIQICASHGKGGGKLAGSTINNVEDMMRVFEGVDIYCMGHDHKRAAVPVSRLRMKPNRKTGEYELKQHRIFLLRSGSFKKAYSKDISSYEVGKLFSPSDLGSVLVNIGFHRDRKETDRIITDIEAVI